MSLASSGGAARSAGSLYAYASDDDSSDEGMYKPSSPSSSTTVTTVDINELNSSFFGNRGSSQKQQQVYSTYTALDDELLDPLPTSNAGQGICIDVNDLSYGIDTKSKEQGLRLLLRNVSFHVDSGEMVAIMVRVMFCYTIDMAPCRCCISTHESSIDQQCMRFPAFTAVCTGIIRRRQKYAVRLDFCKAE